MKTETTPSKQQKKRKRGQLLSSPFSELFGTTQAGELLDAADKPSLLLYD